MGKLGRKKKTDNKKVKTVDYSNVFTFRNIIQMPIEAVVDASIDASLSTFNFIKKFGFKPNKDSKNKNHLGEPIMLNFTYRFNNSGVEQKMHVQIPVLSLITLPYLNIKKAKFDIGIEVLNHVKRTTVDKGNSTIEDSDIYILLGPVDKDKHSQKPNGADESLYKESRISTNMQASMEVENMDLPGGVLQMLNLLNDASSGNGNDLYQLSCEESTIFFDKKTKEISLTVTLTKGKKLLKNEFIKAVVTSETDSNLVESFSEPIEVIEGNRVGNTSINEATALTDECGSVTFKFTSIENPIKNQNGFIYFSMMKASKIAVYYQIKIN